MPLPRPRTPARPRCTWPAPHDGGDLLCASWCCPLTRSGRPRRSSEFRDSITRLRHSLHTLRAPLAGARRNVRFRTAANLSRVGVFTLWVSNPCFIFFSLESSGSVSWRNVLSVVAELQSLNEKCPQENNLFRGSEHSPSTPLGALTMARRARLDYGRNAAWYATRESRLRARPAEAWRGGRDSNSRPSV